MPPKRKRASAVAAAKKLRIASVDDDDEEAEEAEKQKKNEVQFLHKPYKSDATLLSLDDDCFFSIFNRLSLIDLCSIGQTCQRLQQLCSQHFMHRHKSKILIIEKVVDNENMIIGPKGEKYIEVFTSSSRNVTLGQHLSSKAALKRLAKFFKFNEMAKIKNLRFESWKRGLMENHGRLIADMIDEVKSFTLTNSKVVGDLHECILQFLPMMNRFTYRNKDNINNGMSFQWLENTYPNLRYFAWHTDMELPIDLVRRFFEINPAINVFSLQSRSQITLRQLIERNIHINELFFTVSGNPNVFADLQNLCVQQGN